jgi:hypothetical protein
MTSCRVKSKLASTHDLLALISNFADNSSNHHLAYILKPTILHFSPLRHPGIQQYLDARIYWKDKILHHILTKDIFNFAYVKHSKFNKSYLPGV